ncbi:MAG: Gfo/Idh/MocA family oxidoreductase [Gammaproteobacteria bacterium]
MAIAVNDPPPLRLGIVGLGLAGSIMAHNLGRHKSVRLVAACDLHQDALAAFAADFDAFVTTNVDELLALPELDAVYIATPHQLHRPHALAAARQGKHIVVEKPLALTLDDCDQIIAAIAASGVQLVVGHTHSFDPAVAHMAEIIASGEIGRLRMINSFDYTNFLYRPRRPEELDTALGGGIVFNQVPHQIDILRLLADSPVSSVRAATGIWDTDRPTEGAYQAFIGFENGVSATVTYSGYDFFDSDELHDWVGEGGRQKSPGGWGGARRALNQVTSSEQEAGLRQQAGYGAPLPAALGDGEQYQPHFGTTLVSGDGGDLRASKEGLYLYNREGRTEISLPPPSGLIPGWCEVIDELRVAIREQQPPRHDGQWGRDTLKVCLAILESARTNREVLL